MGEGGQNKMASTMVGTVTCSGTQLYLVVILDNLLFTSVRRRFRRVRSRFCVPLAMSEFFGPELGGAYPTMSIYGGPLYTDFLGPFYTGESGRSFPTTSPTAEAVNSDSVLPPGWDDNAVQDLQDIWLNPEESLSNKYHSTVERDDVPQIEELASLFVFRAKTSQRWVPYYTGLSPATTPTATPCPEPAVETTLKSAVMPTHHDIKILAREEEEDEDDLKDWINGMTDDLDISSMLQEASSDLLSCADEENLSVVTSTGQLTCGQAPEGDCPVLIDCEEPHSSQCVASFIGEDDEFQTMDLATTNDGQADRPFPCLPSELKPPVNTPRPSSPATELLLPPAYDDACAHYPDHASCAEEPSSPKSTSVVERDDWVKIAAVATLFVHHAKHSLRHVPYYTCQSPAGTPPSTPRLVMDGSSVDEDVQSLAKRAEDEDIADWVNGMCGTRNQFMHQGEDIQGLAEKVDKEGTQNFVTETCGDQSTPTTLMHPGEDILGLAKKVDMEEPQDFANETGDAQGPAKKVDKEGPQDFVSIDETCGNQSTPTASIHQGGDFQGLEKEDQDNSVVTGMCGASQEMVPTTLMGQDADIQAKKVEKEDQGNLVNEKDMKTDEPKKRKGKWWDLRRKREKMATDRTNGINNDKKDAKKGRKWWRRAFKKKSNGKTSGSDSEAEPRNSWWQIFRKNQSQEKGHGMQDEKTTQDSRGKWWKKGSKKSGKTQDGMDDKTGKIGGWCICM